MTRPDEAAGHAAFDGPPPEGRVFVLRVWHDGDVQAHARRGPWRASLREGTAGERRHFVTLDDLLEHLHGELTRDR